MEDVNMIPVGIDQPLDMTNLKSKEASHREIIDKVGDNGGFFDLVVKPMLQQGHEGELCGWLKEMSLIRTAASCKQMECNGRNLTWTPARIVDKFIWSCQDCKKRQLIREDSFFMSVKCDLKTCLQIIFAWCQSMPTEVVASYLGVKEHIAKKIYERCGKVSEAYVKRHPEEWVLGGQGSILIVDEFPGGYMADTVISIPTNRRRNNNSHTVLCIAEASAVPPRMWMHVMQMNPAPAKASKSKVTNIKCNMLEEALREITGHARPGSYIIANDKAQCCKFEALQELKQYRVLSVEYLQKFDPPGKSELLNNLETIWQTGIGVCEEIQEATQTLGQQILSMHLWRQRFATTPSAAFQSILNHIAEYFRFS